MENGYWVGRGREGEEEERGVDLKCRSEGGVGVVGPTVRMLTVASASKALVVTRQPAGAPISTTTLTRALSWSLSHVGTGAGHYAARVEPAQASSGCLLV
eukprot:756668-Hanusia_phi.AAC.1